MVIKDFSKKTYEKRIAKIEGEEIDVSKIPTRVMLRLIELKEKQDDTETTSTGDFNEIIEIIAVACRKNKKITPDWLKDNTDIIQLLNLMAFIIEPLKERAVEISKNVETPLKNQKPKS